MRNGKSPQEACEALCQRIIDINGGTKNMNRQQRRASKSKRQNTLRKENGVLVSNENYIGLVSKSVRRSLK